MEKQIEWKMHTSTSSSRGDTKCLRKQENLFGTGHAILSCMDAIDGPFAVINADDYYGRHAYR